MDILEFQMKYFIYLCPLSRKEAIILYGQYESSSVVGADGVICNLK